MKKQVSSTAVIAAVIGILIVVGLIGYFTLRSPSGPVKPPIAINTGQGSMIDPISQGKHGGK